MWVTVVHLVVHRPKDQMRNSCVSMKLDSSFSTHSWAATESEVVSGELGARYWVLRPEGGKESCCCHQRDKRGRVVTEERTLGPFSSSIALLFLLSLLFCQKHKSLSECFSKQAGERGVELRRSQFQLYACSLRKAAAVLLSSTQRVRWEERDRNKVERLDEMLTPNGKLEVAA